ncbi:MAG: type II and III secretion system family protein [Rhodospirillales bacterium]|nr:type II and III secretion system family protein [Rhodospirillales bacterium]
MQSYSRTVFLCFSLFALFSISGCDLSKNALKVDRERNMEFQDFRDALASRQPEIPQAKKDAGVPPLQDYVAPASTALKPMPLVSLSVNQTVPIRDVLFELAEQAGYDIELDPRIKGSIIFTAKERPFDLVVQRIADIAGLRFKFENDILRVELDKPYNVNYKIDYLNYIRRNKGAIRNDIAVVSGKGANTGSDYEASTESEADFWGELEHNLAQILGTGDESGALKTKKDPRITAAEGNPAPVEPVVTQGQTESGPSSDVNVQVQPPEAVLRVESLPLDDEDDQGARQQQQQEGQAKFSINKQAGIVSVYGTDRQHREIDKYLKDLHRSVTSQVLIEAKVLEVGLTDEFAAGIDWSALEIPGGETTLGFTIAGATKRPSPEPSIDPAANFRIAYSGNDLSAVVDAISRFGTVRALASPRLTVLNNQSAVLNVATNQVYFEISINTTTDNGVTTTDIDSDIRNVPEGILINVQPSVDLDTRTVSLSVRPTVTRITEFVNDPAVAFAVAQAGVGSDISSPVPVVNVQEMDSVVRMHSGEAIVMGGLMQDRTISQQNGVPVLSEIPMVGSMFRTQGDNIQKSELIIFLRATIIDADGDTVSPADKETYRGFASDRRPLRL